MPPTSAPSTVPQQAPSRFGKLTFKISIFVSLLMIVSLTFFSAVFIISEKNKVTRDIVTNGKVFAQFTTRTIYDQYLNYYTRLEQDQFETFKSNMKTILSQNTDVTDVSLVGMNGLILFDSSELQKRKYSGNTRTISDQRTLDLIKTEHITTTNIKSSAGEDLIEIVSPVVEEAGGHILSVRYLVSYNSLKQRMIEVYTQAFGVVIPLLIVSILFSIPFSISITNPIVRLTNATATVRKGNFDVQIKESSNDEIGDLAKSFNQMINDLKKSRAEIEEYNLHLEQKISERTQQLAVKISELENLNKFMVGRELKMAELKQKIVELQNQIKPAS